MRYVARETFELPRFLARSAISTGPICSSIISIISIAIGSCSRATFGSFRAATRSRFGERQQLAGVRDPVVVEHRVHPLLPLGALMHEHGADTEPGTKIQEVRWSDPRLREPADQQQLPQMPAVCPVGLRALLLALQSAGLRRLGQMRLSTNTLNLLNEKPPAGGRLQRDFQIP
jgi:hypothetical protein